MVMPPPKKPSKPPVRVIPDSGKHGGAGLPRVARALAKGEVEKTADATGATGAGRTQLGEAPYSGIQSLADFTEGLPDFMVGMGIAGLGFTLVTDFGTFNLGIGGTSGNPLGFLSRPGFGQLFNAGFKGTPGGATLSPPNNMKGTTSSGPSGGTKG